MQKVVDTTAIWKDSVFDLHRNGIYNAILSEGKYNNNTVSGAVLVAAIVRVFAAGTYILALLERLLCPEMY